MLPVPESWGLLMAPAPKQQRLCSEGDGVRAGWKPPWRHEDPLLRLSTL